VRDFSHAHPAGPVSGRATSAGHPPGHRGRPADGAVRAARLAGTGGRRHRRGHRRAELGRAHQPSGLPGRRRAPGPGPGGRHPRPGEDLHPAAGRRGRHHDLQPGRPGPHQGVPGRRGRQLPAQVRAGRGDPAGGQRGRGRAGLHEPVAGRPPGGGPGGAGRGDARAQPAGTARADALRFRPAAEERGLAARRDRVHRQGLHRPGAPEVRGRRPRGPHQARAAPAGGGRRLAGREVRKPGDRE
jgi:hypothetical protein